MKRMIPTIASLVFSAAMVPVLAVSAAQADDGPLSRVQYTLAREHSVQKQIDLPGTVEAPSSSQVASEVEGIVAKLHAREGSRVKKGDPLVSVKSDHLDLQLQAATAQHREAEARFALAEHNLERSSGLYDKEILSRQQLDDARFELEAWRGRVDQLEAEMKRIQLDIERSIVRAPFSGVVAAELTEVGQWVGKGATVMELFSPYNLEIRIELPERYFADFKTGADVRVTFEAIPGYETIGKVASIVPRANVQARTFPMRIKVRNDENRIGAGMLAKVALGAGTARKATLVPKDALITRGSKKFVYVIDSGGTVEMVPVTTGIGVGSWVAVEGGLTPSAKVITRGNERVRPGQRVLAEPMEYGGP